jgi:ribosomal protein L19
MKNNLIEHVLNNYGNFNLTNKGSCYTSQNITGSVISVKMNQSLSKGKRNVISGVCFSRRKNMNELYLKLRSKNNGTLVDYFIPAHSPAIEDISISNKSNYISRRSKIYNVKPN